MISQDSHITISTLDTLMQDTWLLALAVRNGQSITVDDALYQHCFSMVQQVQDKLNTAGAPDSLCDEIKFAHCVFLDELIMTIPEADISAWWRRTPLQGHFLGHLNGGEHFYEHIKNLLREPAPSETLLVCYQRMLKFGYSGKYRVENDTERQSLLQQLEKRLPEVAQMDAHWDIVRCSGPAEMHWWRSPQMAFVSLLLLTAGLWGGLRLFLLTQ
ncbi:type IV secretion protein DotU [Pantoea rodasii]|uniref:Type IV secretion protein DotU n=3 Tax=Pantoea TaxID=53335 RepID=A0A0U3V1W7_9GAMM|nr:type VI secretion system protein TssL, short form [Pantoea rodasii]ALV93105.1 type IV secretion protein DotU [Pantoea vagans]KHJ68307.1 type IV secretion protein DotU [Pantoea rodasii]